MIFASTIDEKDKYWSDELNKHDHKRYEVECINRIRTVLENKLGKSFWNLKPEFQAPVITNERRAFIDLYFPALNIGIEVDEGQHAANKKADEIREFDIIETLAARNRSGYKAYHICVYNGYERKMNDFNIAIDAIIEAAKVANKNGTMIWNDRPGLAAFTHGSFIKSGAVFVNKSDVSNTLLQESLNGKAKPGQKSKLENVYLQNGLSIPKKCAVQQTWPDREISKLYANTKLALRNKDKWNHKMYNGKVKEEWMNDVSADLSTFDMYNNIPNYPAIRAADNDKSHNSKDDNKIHQFFSHNDDGTVVYLGAYKLDKVEKTNRVETYIKNKKTITVNFKYVLRWKKVADKIKVV